MLSPSHIQFRLMAPEAQRAAVQRLALHGWDAPTISALTGLREEDVNRHVAECSFNALTCHGTWRSGHRPCDVEVADLVTNANLTGGDSKPHCHSSLRTSLAALSVRRPI